MSSTITPRELAERQSAGEAIELIDVRTRFEFARRRVEFARNVPLAELDPESLSTDKLVCVICESGARGRSAQKRLARAGVDALNVEGGTAAWEAAGLPLTRASSKVISLERQVRMAAGLLVLSGVLFGALVHPLGYALAAFIGAGLVFAGATDTCGMGLLLARMPWNRSPTADSTGQACGLR